MKQNPARTQGAPLSALSPTQRIIATISPSTGEPPATTLVVAVEDSDTGAVSYEVQYYAYDATVQYVLTVSLREQVRGFPLPVT